MSHPFSDLNRFVLQVSMKSRILAVTAPALLFLSSSGPALALDGEPYIHDPSTVLQCDGKYYTWGTGGGLGGGHSGAIHVKWSKTLDPNSSDYGWNDDQIVASSDGAEAVSYTHLRAHETGRNLVCR